MELKLYLYIDPCGVGDWYCCETFDEFYEAIIEEAYDESSEECNTKEKIKNFFNECPYIDFFEVESDKILRFASNEGACNVFPDELFNMPLDKKITVKEFLKYCKKGYLGYELFEIL